MEISKEGKTREKTGGRKAGTPNKNTKAVKDMITQALDKAGGVEYLVEQARANPKAFLALVGRVLPYQVHGTGQGGALVLQMVSNDEGL